MASSPAAIADILQLLVPQRTLGTGSNGIVVQCELPSHAASRFPSVPSETPLALKVVSHFWDPAALELLDCERDAYSNIVPHENIVRVFVEFTGPIPTSLHPFLPHDMLQVRTSFDLCRLQAFLAYLQNKRLFACAGDWRWLDEHSVLLDGLR